MTIMHRYIIIYNAPALYKNKKKIQISLKKSVDLYKNLTFEKSENKYNIVIILF